MSPSGAAARLRGGATGLVTAALAVAAHGVGGGTAPTGAAAVQLTLLAATIGTLAATIAHAARARVLVGLLAVGQLIGHVMLSAVEHHHTLSPAPPAGAMLAAHLLAIVAGAVLIAAGDRLCRAVSRAARAVVRMVCPPVAVAGVVPARRADHPLRSALLLAASMSHRGPPVGITA
jgi:hypothetical protein